MPKGKHTSYCSC